MGDGRCVVDVTLKDIQKPTRYHPVGLALSAAFVVATCVRDHDPKEGGTLEGFGKCVLARDRGWRLMIVQTRARI